MPHSGKDHAYDAVIRTVCEGFVHIVCTWFHTFPARLVRVVDPGSSVRILVIHMRTAFGNIHVSFFQVFAFYGFADRHFTHRIQAVCQRFGKTNRHMLHDQNRRIQILRKSRNHGLQCLGPAGRAGDRHELVAPAFPGYFGTVYLDNGAARPDHNSVSENAAGSLAVGKDHCFQNFKEAFDKIFVFRIDRILRFLNKVDSSQFQSIQSDLCPLRSLGGEHHHPLRSAHLLKFL